jgi:hypothetical protein
VEALVDNEEVVAAPEWTTIWGAHVVHAPGGAYPGGVNGRTPPDLDSIGEYARAGAELLRGNSAPYDAFLQAFVEAA